MNKIETRIRERSYQSPSRARATISRSSLKPKDKARLVTLVEAWENEGVVDHVVAGLPEAASVEPEGLEAELVDVATGVHPINGSSGPGSRLPVRAPGLRINLNAAVRVRLTMLGVAQLHDARDRVQVPDDLLERCGVWETTLWELMSAFGDKLTMGDAPFEGALIEVLDPRVPQ